MVAYLLTIGSVGQQGESAKWPVRFFGGELFTELQNTNCRFYMRIYTSKREAQKRSLLNTVVGMETVF